MKAYGEALGGFFRLFKMLIPLAILGVWKLIEIIIWLIHHIKIV